MTGPVPIRLEAALLRAALPELVLREGMTLAARVLERSGHRGTLSLAGRQVAAELPETLAPGAEVRLRVEEAGPERVLLRVVDQAPAAVAVPPPVVVPLPGGRRAHVAIEAEEEREGRGGGGAPPAVTVTYASAALGTFALRLTLEPGTLRALVEAAPRGAQAAREASEALRDALADAAGRPADVRIVERREPLDVYA